MEWFEAFGSPNVSTFLILLQAEELALTSRHAGALVVLYTNAIDALKAEGTMYLEALANERLSMNLSALGSHDLSKPYFDRALNLYSDWGAIAKYEWMLVERNLRFRTCNDGRLPSSIDEIHV